MFAHLPGAMLGYDRDNAIHLLASVPPEWLHAGAVNQLRDWHTAAGTINLTLTVSADGRSAELRIPAITTRGNNVKVLVHLQSLLRAGFALPASTKANARSELEIPAGQAFSLTLSRAGG